MHHGRRDNHGHRGYRNMGKYSLNLGAVVAWNRHRIEHHGIDGSFFNLAGIDPQPDHDRMDMGYTELFVNLMDDPAESGGVARTRPGQNWRPIASAKLQDELNRNPATS